MKVVNIHQRLISQPIENVSQLLKTLATKEDAIWPKESWPEMRFKNGLKVESKGGHGRVRYTIIAFEEDKHIKFEFTKPEGFIGTHELNITALSKDETEISHMINMRTTSFKATSLWITVIRWLHDALIEDAFDKVENYFSVETKTSRHNFWVRFLRSIYKRKSFKVKHV